MEILYGEPRDRDDREIFKYGIRLGKALGKPYFTVCLLVQYSTVQAGVFVLFSTIKYWVGTLAPYVCGHVCTVLC